jgi:capsular polysaccharide biosynthesis protein
MNKLKTLPLEEKHLNQKNENYESIDLREVLFILKKHWKLLVIVPIVCAVSALLISKYIITPKYAANVTLIVNAAQNSQNTTITYDQLTTAQELVGTYSIILKSDTVLDKVIQNLNLDTTAKELSKNVSISGVNQTEVIDLSVKDTDPQEASDIANEITKVAPDIIIKTVKAGSVEIISSAKPSNIPVSPNIPLYTAIALIIGFVIFVLFSFVIELLDNSFSSEEDVKKYLELAVIGIIPNIGSKS